MPAPSNYLDKSMSLDEAVPRETRFITKDEVGDGMPVCIDHLTVETLEDEKGQLENKTILHFKHGEKPLILNQTNKELLKAIHGDKVGDILDKWIVLFNDRTIMFGGRVTGGVRLRAATDAEIMGPEKTGVKLGGQAKPDDIPF